MAILSWTVEVLTKAANVVEKKAIIKLVSDALTKRSGLSQEVCPASFPLIESSGMIGQEEKINRWVGGMGKGGKDTSQTS